MASPRYKYPASDSYIIVRDGILVKRYEPYSRRAGLGRGNRKSETVFSPPSKKGSGAYAMIVRQTKIHLSGSRPLPELLPLTERIAENVHDVWAADRIRGAGAMGSPGTARLRLPPAWCPTATCPIPNGSMTGTPPWRPLSSFSSWATGSTHLNRIKEIAVWH